MSLMAEIPLFPLRIVLCPGEKIRLHIFEDRYKEMVRYCLETDEVFGIVLVNDEQTAEVGCTARIERVLQRYNDGRLDIEVIGEIRFRVSSINQEKSYLTAEITPIREPLERLQRGLRERVITQHIKWLELLDEEIRPQMYSNTRFVSYVIGSASHLPLPEKQRLLQTPSENERMAMLADHFSTLIPRMEELIEAKRRIESDGHFEDIPPQLDINLDF